MVKNLPAVWETLGREDPLEKGRSPGEGKIPWRREEQSTPVILAGRIPWTEEPGGPQSMGFAKSWT